MLLPIKLSEDKVVPKSVQLLRVGTFLFENGETIQVTRELLKSFKKNFDKKVRGYEDGRLPIDYFHENEKVAGGWINQINLTNEDTELWADVIWTPRAEKMLADGEIRYVSAEFHFDYQHNEGGTKWGPTLFGAGLTNRPFIKGMAPVVQFQEESEREKLHKALNARADKYDIEVTSDAALTPPAGTEDSESKFGDPVNFKFPIDNPARIANARVRFKQFANQIYKGDKSKSIVHGRIVKAELAAGIDASYDSNDPLDKLLPSDIKSKLEKKYKAVKAAEKDPVSAKIAQLIREGYSQDQAVAIAKNMERKGKLGEGEKPMDLEQAMAKIKELEGIISALKSGKDEVMLKAQDAEKKYAELSDKVEKEKQENLQKDQFNKMLSEGKVVEAQREPFMKNDMVKFSELAKKTHLKADGTSDDASNSDVKAGESAQDKVIELADKMAKEKKMKMSDCISHVLKQNRELREKYEREVTLG